MMPPETETQAPTQQPGTEAAAAETKSIADWLNAPAESAESPAKAAEAPPAPETTGTPEAAPAEAAAPEAPASEAAPAPEPEKRPTDPNYQELYENERKARQEAEQRANQPTPDFALSLSLAEQVDNARGDGKTTAQDRVKEAQEKATTDARERTYQGQWNNAADRMRTVLDTKGMKWGDPRLAEVREDWQNALSEGSLTWANRLIREAQKLELTQPKAQATPPTPPPTPAVNKNGTERKPAGQRDAEMEALTMGGVPIGGAGIRLTPENIDKAYVDWGKEHPNEPNPYTEQYRAFLNGNGIPAK